jgi:branched-chain amino acid aminotransferase
MYFNENTEVYFNGQWLKAAQASFSLYSQSLHYGNSVFEGIRSYEVAGGEARIFKVREHFERLLYSAEKTHLQLNYSVQELTELTYSLLRRNKLTNAYIRPLVFSGVDMSLVPSGESKLLLSAWSWDRYLGKQLLNISLSPFQRPNPKSCVVDAKVSGHYVNSMLATQEAKKRGFHEALLLDSKGYVAEGPGANIFMEKEGCLYTPPRGNILPGITRQTIIELAQANSIPVEEKHFTPQELQEADGALFCGTAVEVAGIGSLDGQPFRKAYSSTFAPLLSEAYNKLVRKISKAAA